MAELKELKDKRTAVKGKITRFETSVKEFKTGDNIFALEARIPDLTDLFKKYETIQSEIETILYAEAEAEGNDLSDIISETNKERAKVESQFYNIIGNIKSILNKNSSQSGEPSDSQNNSTNPSTVINITNKGAGINENSTFLKPLPLPVYSGKYSEWFAFYDTFNSLVHDDQSLSKIRKFHYLRGCLRDEALRAIESFSVTSDNYDSALQALENRFANKRLIVQEHVSNILNIQPIVKSSHIDLRHLLDIVNNNLSALTTLKLPVKSWDALLIPIITEKLDYATKKEWQSSLTKDLPVFDKLKEFLENRCQILEAVDSINSGKNITSSNAKQTNFKQNQNFIKKPNNVNNKFTTNMVTKGSCVICKKAHNILHCNDFLKLNVTERLKLVEQLKLCNNCLRNNHVIDKCKVTTSCKECNNRHHTLLHINEFVTQANTLHVAASNQVLLSTALIIIIDKHGKSHDCRAILDQCSEVNIITANFSKKIGLNVKKINSYISGVNGRENSVSEVANVTIKSRISDFATNFDCLILPQITRATPSISFDKNLVTIPTDISLADPNFNISSQIDMLIGAQLFWSLLIGSAIQLSTDGPFIQNTRLGWIIGGNLSISNQTQIQNASCNLISVTAPENNLTRQFNHFWDQEEIVSKSNWSQEQIDCEKHFQKHTIRLENGKFMVKLPFKTNAVLGDSRNLALRQFFNLERKLQKDVQLKIAYSEFMREYLLLDHMEVVPKEDLELSHSCYLPHHAVFKQTVDGPKIRVVFNASAKTSNNSSLNDHLMTGPTIQQDLFSILCRFRTYQYTLSADITKMYRMILINPSDADYQRILWREDPNQPIQTYRLKTVTYGTTCAPFLAVRTLRQLALESQESFPKISNIINRDFYMDDLLTGSNSIEETIEIKNQISKILASGGFHLTKWASNEPQILSHQNHQSTVVNFNENNDIKVLGFFWNCHDDFLKYRVNFPSITDNQIISKRIILSSVARIFDPLGLINPVVVKTKILIQKLWTLKLDWDQMVPIDIKNQWIKFLKDVPELNNYRINRKVIPSDEIEYAELHGFSDASTKAYGAVVYLKTVDKDGNTTINLLCAKSRVSPLKEITLPKLELNAAVLLTKLMVKVSEILNITIRNRYFWTDSTIVLAWLAEPAKSWKQYISNRVLQIHSCSSPQEWRHVRSADNPADIVSRGASANQLKNATLWWNGPEYLLKNADTWPTVNSYLNINKESPELLRKTATVNIINVEPELPVITKFSSLTKLQRVVAYCWRFIQNCKNKLNNKQQPTVKVADIRTKGVNSSLNADELDNALVIILKHIQSRAFSDEFKKINGKIKPSRLQKLDSFIDNKGLLRVGGRLKHAQINYDHKFPILLPEKHHITKLIIKQIHERELHSGSEGTLAAVRQQFWPLSGRNTVKKIIYSCIKCSRVNPKKLNQKMGDLPRQRLQPVRPFYISGADYIGPFLIKEGRTRRMRKVKVYVALFICFTTKAVHIELVGDLTTESFLAAMRRFVARRGNVAELFCDNGSNFVGAEKEFFRSEKFQAEIKDNFAAANTKFQFIPPRSPHFGGLWERSVRSVKHHLYRVVGDASLTYEEFYTFLTRVEACLNSRPISPLSSDPNDLQPLTPGHFLIGEPLTAPVEKDLQGIPINRLARWQRIQQLHQQFWKRWQKEYLHQLQTRPKGQRQPRENITTGSLVALIEENLPPLRWKLGRIVETHPGTDGVVRVVSVKTINGVFKRALKKVCLIPTDDA